MENRAAVLGFVLERVIFLQIRHSGISPPSPQRWKSFGCPVGFLPLADCQQKGT